MQVKPADSESRGGKYTQTNKQTKQTDRQNEQADKQIEKTEKYKPNQQ